MSSFNQMLWAYKEKGFNRNKEDKSLHSLNTFHQNNDNVLVCTQSQEFNFKNLEEDRIFKISKNHDPIDQHIRLVVLIIIVDDLPFEAIWRIWSQHCSKLISDSVEEIQPVRFLIHAKHPNKILSPWLRIHLAKSFQLQPDWGSLCLTEVMIRLLQEGVDTFKDGSHFVFASESCIPVATIDSILNNPDIMNNDNSSQCVNSWVNYRFEPDNGYSKQKQFDALSQKIPSQYIAKSDQWVCLCRQHAIDILGLPLKLRTENSKKSLLNAKDTMSVSKQFLNTIFSKVNASDEMYFSTCLAMLKHISKSFVDNNNDNNITNNNRNNNIISKKLNVSSQIDSTLTVNDIYNNSSSCNNDSSSNTNDSNSISNFLLNNQCKQRRFTYCEWIAKGDRSPKTFFDLYQKDLDQAKKEGCIFFRKMALPKLNSSNAITGEICHNATTTSSTSISSSRNETNNCSNDIKEKAILSQIGKWLQYVLKIDSNDENTKTKYEEYMSLCQLYIRESRGNIIVSSTSNIDVDVDIDVTASKRRCFR